MAGFRPPVRGIKIIGALFGATVFGSMLRQYGGVGIGVGIFMGVCCGWIVGWWIARQLFD